MLETDDPAEINALLSQCAKDIADIPGYALLHAVRHGASLPPKGADMKPETLEQLAGCLSDDKELLRDLALERPRPADGDSPEMFGWTRALVFAAVRIFDWKGEEDSGEKWRSDGMALARRFSETEKVYLNRVFTPAAQADETVLPPLHRMGRAVVCAFAALEIRSD